MSVTGHVVAESNQRTFPWKRRTFNLGVRSFSGRALHGQRRETWPRVLWHSSARRRSQNLASAPRPHTASPRSPIFRGEPWHPAKFVQVGGDHREPVAPRNGGDHAITVSNHVAVSLQMSADVAVGIGRILVERENSVLEWLQKEFPSCEQPRWGNASLRARAGLGQSDGANMDVCRGERLKPLREAEAAFEYVRARVGVEQPGHGRSRSNSIPCGGGSAGRVHSASSTRGSRSQ